MFDWMLNDLCTGIITYYYNALKTTSIFYIMLVLGTCNCICTILNQIYHAGIHKQTEIVRINTT